MLTLSTLESQVQDQGSLGGDFDYTADHTHELADQCTTDFPELNGLFVGVQEDFDGFEGEVGVWETALDGVVDGVVEEGKEALGVSFEEAEGPGETGVWGGLCYSSRVVEMELGGTGRRRLKPQIPDEHLRLAKESHQDVNSVPHFPFVRERHIVRPKRIFPRCHYIPRPKEFAYFSTFSPWISTANVSNPSYRSKDTSSFYIYPNKD